MKKLINKIGGFFQNIKNKISATINKIKKSRIYILTVLQLSNKKQRRKYNFAARSGITFVMVILITILISFVLYAIDKFLGIELKKEIQIVFFVLLSLISLVTNTFSLISDLYKSKDYAVLLPLPVKKDEIFISKLLVYYFSQLSKDLIFFLSIFIAFGFTNKVGAPYYILTVILFPIVTGFNVLLAVVLSTLFDIFRKFISKHNVLKLVFGLLLYLGISALILVIINLLPEEIRISQLYNQFVTSLYNVAGAISKVTFFYTNIVNTIYLSNPLLNIGIIILASGIIVGLNYLIMKKHYLDSVWNNQEFTPKKKHHKDMKKSKTIFGTFFKKEVKLATRDLGKLIKNYGLLFFLPIMLYTINFIFAHMRLSSLGVNLTLTMDFLFIIFIMTSTNTVMATSLTEEGMEFVLMKNAPSDTSSICYSKLLIHLIITTIPLIASIIVMSLPLVSRYPLSFTVLDLTLLGVCALLINVSHMMWSMQLDVMHPKLNEFASTGSISDNLNVKESQMVGMGISIFFTIIFIFLTLVFRNILFIGVLVIALGLLGHRTYSLKKIIKYYFNDIEF